MRTTMNIDQRWNRTSALLAAALFAGSAAIAGAQERTPNAAASQWAPWVGCWQASGRDAQTLELSPGSQTPAPIVCVVPATGNAVDLVTVTGAQIGTPERVDANGTRRAVTREGCDGWETAEFSPNGERIYVRSEFQCSGNRTRTSTGIMSISPNGEWLDVQGVKVAEHNGVRVVHYGHVPVPAALPAEMKTALESNKMATATAMLAASDSLQIADVIEATKQVDPLVVQTWLAERGQGFTMDAKKLTQLADAGVSPNVIDLMVALSYPREFAINLAQSNGQIVPTEQTRANAEALDPRNDTHVVFMDWDPLYSGSYGYGYGSFYGYRGYWGSPYSWYNGNRPVVIVTRPSNNVDDVSAPDRRGRMVRGRGYTRRPSDGGDTGRSAGSPRGSTTSSDRGSSSGGSTSSGSGGGSTRTAKPRSP
jgi:uncharacterized membrane protein YgcG